jgi:sulfite exporter TauE/SafE/copper chaperone CopZ
MKTYTLHVSGMHCASCPLLIEGELSDLPHITQVKASLKHHHVEVTGEFGEKTLEEIAQELTTIIKSHGYGLTPEKQKHDAKWHEFGIAVPIAIGFIAFFILLQKLGLVNLVTTSEVSYGTAFVIGMIASVSTCMAVVGGLVLSMSANYAKGGDKVRPQLLFHMGRLVSFFVLGGVIGALGSVFKIGITETLVLSLTIAVVLLILGINLLDVFPWAKKLQPTLPRFIGGHVHGLKKINHTLTPIFLGVATFFLPCGFTQSMQIYTLSTGSFTSGALTMFVFALGTLPVLALLSFSSLTIHTKARSSIFFKTAGLVVIFFGLFNLHNGLVVAGIIPSLFSF